jgi:formate dehydrogenase major subunit
VIELKARADSTVAPGQIFSPFSFAEAAARVLTNAQLDPLGKIPEYKILRRQGRTGRSARGGTG